MSVWNLHLKSQHASYDDTPEDLESTVTALQQVE